MMRAPRCLAVAVRRPDGTLVVREDAWVSLWERLQFLRWPGFRGTVVLAESLLNGLSALNFSAKEADPEAKEQGGGLAMTISVVLAIGLFVGLPHALAWGAGRAAGTELGVDTFLFHVLDGFFKLAIFIGYIWGISHIPEIRRVFEYHGAEHKVVNAFENGMEPTVENARKFTTFHARCGTSFLLFVLVLSIFMFAAVFPFIPTVSDINLVNHVAMILIKVPLMFPLAGLAYEVNRYASRHPGQLWVQAIVFPGRLMQRLTTREPSDDQLEIAVAAMQTALSRDAALQHLDLSATLAAKAQLAGKVSNFQNLGEVISALPSR